MPTQTADVVLETSYSQARICVDPSRPGGRLLFLGGVVCSYVDLHDDTHLEFPYIRRIGDLVDAAAPAGKPLRVTHIGGGGFTLPRYLAATRPGSRQLVYEVDGGLVDIARSHLGLVTSPALRVKIGDAAQRLPRRAAGSADLILSDAFVGRQVPVQLASEAFFGEVSRVLAPSGTFAMNLIDAPPLAFCRSVVAGLMTHFRYCALVTDADVLRGKDTGNVVLIGSAAALPLAQIRRRAATGPAPDRVIDSETLRAFMGTARPLTGSG